LNSDAELYGGSGAGNLGGVMASEEGSSIGAECTLPPLATIWLEFDPAG
jgi:1,4-alpha-glucan branching enzyme